MSQREVAASAGSRVGIYGGTFNPIHLGHLRAAEEVRETLALSRMVFVPSADPPHKLASSSDPLAPAAERLAWVKAAIADNPAFSVDDLEIARGGVSYMVDTLTTFAGRTAPEKPVFVIGQDAFALLGSWREPRRLLTLAHFAVTTRPPILGGHLADWLPKELADDVDIAKDGQRGRHRRAGTEIRLVPISGLLISATDIRARLREGRSVRYLLPDAVRESVQQSGVFS